MENFRLGIEAAAYNLSSLLHTIIQYQLFWGFAIGFLVSTLVHAFLMSDHPSHVPYILTHGTDESFEKIYGQEGDKDTHHYAIFTKMAGSIKWIFSFAILLFMTIILVALVRG